MTDRPEGRRRILVGTIEIGGTLPDFADGFRRLGHSVTTVIREPNRFYPDFRYDVDISVTSPDIVPWPPFVSRSRSWAIRVPRGATNRLAFWSRHLALMLRHDIFLFQWGGKSLTEGNREFALLKRLGKRIVSVFNGSDIRSPDAYLQQFDALPTDTEFKKQILTRTADDPFKPLRNLRTGELHSDLIVSVPNQSSLAVRPYMHFLVPVDVAKYSCDVPGHDVPVIVHAPSWKGFKGTAPILEALDKLRDAGIPFDLRLLEGVTNQEVRNALRTADVAIDQLYAPLHGKFGLEAMASGCALATCNREDYEPFPPGRPIWHIEAANLTERLGRLLTDKHLRVRLAHEGRKYVEQFHDHVAVARRIIRCLDAGVDRYDHYPTFFARRYRPEQEIPRELQELTARVIRQWGLPADVDAADLVARGLVPSGGLGRVDRIARWRATEDSVSRESERQIAARVGCA